MQDIGTSFDRALAGALARWDIPLEPDRLATLRAHFLAMVDANRSMNLTRITDPVDAAVKHYADSIALLPWADRLGDRPLAVLDIGSGAGFPAAPIATMRPDWSVLALEATRKKVEFLASTARTIGLTNLACVQGHSAHWCPPRRFDLVVFRAPAKLDEAIRHAADAVAPGGWIVAYKGAVVDDAERRRADKRASTSGLQFSERFGYDLMWHEETIVRSLVVYHKAS